MKEVKVEGNFGGQKYDGAKADYTLVPPDAYKAVAEVMTAGAKKYSKNNWVGLELSRVLAALERHLEAFKSGEGYAEDSGQHHLAHAIANAMMAYHIAMNFPEQDDRLFTYVRGPSPAKDSEVKQSWEDLKDYAEKESAPKEYAPRPSYADTTRKRSWLEVHDEGEHVKGCRCNLCDRW